MLLCDRRSAPPDTMLRASVLALTLPLAVAFSPSAPSILGHRRPALSEAACRAPSRVAPCMLSPAAAEAKASLLKVISDGGGSGVTEDKAIDELLQTLAAEDTKFDRTVADGADPTQPGLMLDRCARREQPPRDAVPPLRRSRYSHWLRRTGSGEWALIFERDGKNSPKLQKASAKRQRPGTAFANFESDKVRPPRAAHPARRCAAHASVASFTPLRHGSSSSLHGVSFSDLKRRAQSEFYNIAQLFGGKGKLMATVTFGEVAAPTAVPLPSSPPPYLHASSPPRLLISAPAPAPAPSDARGHHGEQVEGKASRISCDITDASLKLWKLPTIPLPLRAKASVSERLHTPRTPSELRALPACARGGGPEAGPCHASTPPPPPPRTKWTRRVPHPVLIGHAASLTPY